MSRKVYKPTDFKALTEILNVPMDLYASNQFDKDLIHARNDLLV